jgi:hypothetical protein
LSSDSSAILFPSLTGRDGESQRFVDEL